MKILKFIIFLMTWNNPIYHKPVDKFEPCDQDMNQLSPKNAIEMLMACSTINDVRVMPHYKRLKLWEKYGGKVRKNQA